jgi:pyruvate formate lyase activating enzyme
VIVAGLQKNSFIDFPGKISCVLFLTGCNFFCPYCHNPELAWGNYPQQIPFSEAVAFLTARQGMLEGVTITGGEPTLENGLPELCQTIKSLGYPIKLDTNGSRPGILSKLLDRNLLDFVAMDIKAPFDAYDAFSRHPHIQARLAESIRLIMDSAPAYEFRTTCVAPFIDAEAVKSIAKVIEGATNYVLQTFNRQATCLDPAFKRKQDPTIVPETMQQLKMLAEPFVTRCIVR